LKRIYSRSDFRTVALVSEAARRKRRVYKKVHRAEISRLLKMRRAMSEVPPNSGFAKDFVKP
jgi:hypothetical protein